MAEGPPTTSRSSQRFHSKRHMSGNFNEIQDILMAQHQHPRGYASRAVCSGPVGPGGWDIADRGVRERIVMRHVRSNSTVLKAMTVGIPIPAILGILISLAVPSCTSAGSVSPDANSSQLSLTDTC